MHTLRRWLVLWALLLGAALAQDGDQVLPLPNPELGPVEVVRIQLAALQANDDPYPDAGIAITFGFASPGNRMNTGPLERFTNMLKGPTYSTMLYHLHVDYGVLEFDGDVARVPLVLTTSDGRRVGYVFILSRQIGGEHAGSWMTDAVLRFEVRQPEEG